MRLICGPDTFDKLPAEDGTLRVVLYGQPTGEGQGSAGAAAKSDFLHRRLEAAPRAWDLLSIALSVMSADCAGLRDKSPDGWTRDFELDIAVAEPEFWTTQATDLARMLAFLTTDRWMLRFHPGGLVPPPPRAPIRPPDDSVVLLSGGLDSLVGAIDLATAGRKPFAISQIVRGDAKKQEEFAERIGGGLNHLQMNHNATAGGPEDTTQRARSLIFLTFGVLTGTALDRYKDEEVPLYVCENGFIALNPPLTGGRLGSLSTRTAHPEVLARFQGILDAAALRVRIVNPYGAKTKGEMLRECTNQPLLRELAVRSTSCGRFQRYNYKHCGRCVPCQVRRAAFLTWGENDKTEYVFTKLGKKDENHARFDDVRAVALALATVDSDGFDAWLGGSLSSPMIGDAAALKAMVARALEELRALHLAYGVK
jgi:7-cyano-7-deazaguanine synthase in queuosine biosynthesis